LGSLTEPPRRIVIVGAGHGGGTVAATLRQQGFDGEVVLIGGEPVGPYHRPPLSKNVLKGDFDQPLHPKDFYADNGIELRVEARVRALDTGARRVTLLDGTELTYDVLVLATGARARRLAIPGIDLPKVYELRTIAHARALSEVLTPNTHLAIVGGGWIGLEVAASARRAGVGVTVLERESRLLARVASPELSHHLTEHHRRQGVTIVTGAAVDALRPGPNGAVGSIALAERTAVEADHVLVGVGAVAEDDLARQAGLKCANGIVVDYTGHTSDPAVFAVGDVTRRPLMLLDGLHRLESIPSTVEQSRQVTAAILGTPPPPPEVPWFWSDQFDLKLQIAGLIGGADMVSVRAEATRDKLAIFHTRQGRLVAFEGVNASAEFMAARHLIRDQVEIDLDALADTTVALDKVAAPRAPQVAHDTVPEPPPSTNGAAAPPGPGGNPGRPLATFIQTDGQLSSVEIPAGKSLMEGSIQNNLPGIIAECGGMCSCGTCHVYVDEPWATLLPEPEYEEDDLLEFIDGRQGNSRLSCQLVMGDELDGIVVRVATYS
jgi:3-phenylpropionate/trans-cinnamate dioxygenase ferredoxin reductase subunit